MYMRRALALAREKAATDMAQMLGLGNCCICGRIFSFNPETVPSVVGMYGDTGFRLDLAGKREPICLACMRRGNEMRVRNGKEPFEIPADAYEPEEI
jgi:hypothetical protein